jgi:hypothetical protein
MSGTGATSQLEGRQRGDDLLSGTDFGVRRRPSAGGNRIRTIGPSLEQIVCLASRTVAIGEKIREPDGRKAFAESC